MGLGDSSELPEGAVVHHIDGNHDNYEGWNLMLFASSGDHIRWHRGFSDEVVPLWDGSAGR